jgi:TonB family protein
MLVTAAATWMMAAVLPAQSVLLAEHAGKLYVVRKVVGVRAYVEVDGKLAAAGGSRCALRHVDEYVPAFIAVRHMTVKASYVNLIGTGAQINNEFHLQATFESAYNLDDVFMVLELNSERLGKSLFYYEIGRMEPNTPRLITATFPLSTGLGPGHFKLHLFTHGAEVFHSEMPVPYRERMLDRMVAKRIAGIQDAEPKAFIGPAPEYPPALREKKIKGEAVVGLRLSPRGVVLDPAVARASDPAFGEAALEAVRQWRFLPAVKQGRAIETKVEMPFNFSP